MSRVLAKVPRSRVDSHSSNGADWDKVLELWNSNFPAEVHMSSVEALQKVIEVANCKHYTIRNSALDIEAWMAVFDRYETRWFSILVDAEAQGRGLGKALILHAQSIEPKLEGWVVQSNAHLRSDGQPYISPLDFYYKMGFRLNPNRFSPDGKLDVVCVKWTADR